MASAKVVADAAQSGFGKGSDGPVPNEIVEKNLLQATTLEEAVEWWFADVSVTVKNINRIAFASNNVIYMADFVKMKGGYPLDQGSRSGQGYKITTHFLHYGKYQNWVCDGFEGRRRVIVRVT
ncbi:hypothetical protein KIW84_022145 [Lathyrus oleraceus]|uniref:Uncharacterized protein n=1 Tax=Pisum sativum TaxID=3888 RepID=A0A9D5B9K6_PEA|nr:hypothetical protein KIW84_022145 [Pisum sativum]